MSGEDHGSLLQVGDAFLPEWGQTDRVSLQLRCCVDGLSKRPVAESKSHYQG